MPVTSPTYQLPDDQYAQIEDLLPPNGQRGGQWKDHRRMIDGILWALSDGGRWRNLPERFGPWQSVYDRFRSWTRRGLWDKILRRLQARKMRAGAIDWELFCIDGSVVRAHQSAAGASKKNARPGSRRTMPSAAAREASGRSCT
jgi:transposase